MLMPSARPNDRPIDTDIDRCPQTSKTNARLPSHRYSHAAPKHTHRYSIGDTHANMSPKWQRHIARLEFTSFESLNRSEYSQRQGVSASGGIWHIRGYRYLWTIYSRCAAHAARILAKVCQLLGHTYSACRRFNATLHGMNFHSLWFWKHWIVKGYTRLVGK